MWLALPRRQEATRTLQRAQLHRPGSTAAEQATWWAQEEDGQACSGRPHWGNTRVTCPALSQNGQCTVSYGAVANSRMLRGFKQHTRSSYSSGSYKSKMNLPGLKARCWQGCFLLEALGHNPFPHLSQRLEATCILSLWPHHSNLCVPHPSSFSD